MLSPINYGSASEILINLQDCAAKSIKAQSCHADQSTLRPIVNYVARLRASLYQVHKHANAGCAVLSGLLYIAVVVTCLPLSI